MHKMFYVNLMVITKKLIENAQRKMRNETEYSNKENREQWKREREKEKEQRRTTKNHQKTMIKMAKK